MSMNPSGMRRALCAGALLCAVCGAQAGPFRDALEARLAARAGAREGTELPAGARLISDLAYGADARQRFDVYLPAQAKDAPVIFMVHGGAWEVGDKASGGVVGAKMARWVARGFVFVSVNYRMLPVADPLTQARDVAAALAAAQARAREWGADPEALVLMGHSAGAQLVALLASRPELVRSAGARPWLGTVALDSAVYDLPRLMTAPHLKLYDRAFGADPAYWRANSPTLQLQAEPAPFLAVCSTKRANACPQAQSFVARAQALGGRAETLGEDLSHMEINRELGLESAYTRAVEHFLAGLGGGLASRLAGD